MNEQTEYQDNLTLNDQTQPKKSVGSFVAQVKNKFVPTIKEILFKLKESRLYKNKLVFWTLTGLVGTLLLVIVLGLLFGTRNKLSVVPKTPPTPVVESPVQTITQEDGPLFQIDQKLKNLKIQIGSFDVKQSRLKPPTVNFNIKF